MIPPFPARHEGRLPLARFLRSGSRSVIAVWNRSAFRASHIETRVLSRRLLVLNAPEMIADAFIAQAGAFERKSPQMRHALEPLLGDGLIISDGLVWKARRPQVQRVTHPSRMEALVPVMTEVAAEWQEDWARRPDGAVVDALAEMARFAAEVIARTIFGTALGREAAHRVVEAFAQYQAVIGNTDMLSLLGLPDILPRWQGWRAGASARRIQAVVDALISRIIAGEGESSLIAAMMQGGGSMAREGFRNEAITLFLAGHETTANTLAWCWFLLSEAPEAEAAVAEESRRVLGGRAAGWEDLPNLPWARAVVEEALRLYPPIPLLAREAQEDTEVRGIPVPRRGIVLVSPWVVHRHQDHWEAPDEFRPERFLPGAPAPQRFTYLPFSLGPRVCTGQHFGLYEAVIALSSLAGRFRLRPVEGKRAFPVARLTLRPGATLPLRLGHRP